MNSFRRRGLIALTAAVALTLIAESTADAAPSRPVVTRVSAPLMTVDGGGTLTVIGSHFTRASRIVIGGITRKTTYLSSRKLRAITPWATAYGQAAVRVRTGKLISRVKPAAVVEYTNRPGPGSAAPAATFARCQRLQYYGNFFLRVTADPPVATGPDIRAGITDYTYVRYQALLVVVQSGAIHKVSGWSDWLVASDAQPATWTGVSSLQTDTEAGSYVMQYRLEWGGPAGSTAPVPYGTSAMQVNLYNSFTIFNEGPIGPFSACAALL